MAILLKTASVRVSSIQIMQVRVQNKGKSVWKSIYIGEVSTPPRLNLCFSSSSSVDKLKMIKKNFYNPYLILLLQICKASIQVFSKIAMVLFLCRNKSSRNDLKLHGEYFWN